MKYKIYMFYCENWFEENGCKSIYIGSSKNVWQRMHNHRDALENINSKSKNFPLYKCMHENGGYDNWQVIILDEIFCNNLREAEEVEQKYIDLFKSDLNGKRAFLSDEERIKKKLEITQNWREDNQIHIKNYNKNYHQKTYENKKEILIERVKNYALNNPDKILERRRKKQTCGCGTTFNHFQQQRHFRTEKHKNWLKCQEV
jgi:hypothetical protein